MSIVVDRLRDIADGLESGTYSLKRYEYEGANRIAQDESERIEVVVDTK